MRQRRLLSLLFLDVVRVRFIGMSLAGLLLIGLTATAERGAAVFGLSYVMRPQAPANAISPPPVSSIEVTVPPPTPKPSSTTPAITPPPRAGQLPASRTPASSPAGVTPLQPLAPEPPRASPPTAPAPAPSPPPAEAPSNGSPPAPPAPAPTTAAPSATPPPSPTPSASPLSFAVTTGATPYLFQVSGIVPGDTWTRDATVTNTGGTSFRFVFEFTQTASSLLWTDPDGLHVQARSGSTVLYDGLAAAMGQVSAPNVIAPGGSEALRFVFSLPVAADNRFQALSQEIQIVFTATQTP